MTTISEANLLCVHIADAPEVTRHVRALMTRIEIQEERIKYLLRENELLAEQNEVLRRTLAEAEVGHRQQDAAGRARAHANSFLNRH